MKFANLFPNEKSPIDASPGELLITEGKKGDRLFVVLEGEVEIFIGDEVLETVEEGGIFGEMSLIDFDPASASARAKTDIKLATIDESRFLYLVQQHPTFALGVMRVMAMRLRRMNPQ